MKRKLSRGFFVRLFLANAVSAFCLFVIASRQHALRRSGIALILALLGVGLLASGVFKLAKAFSKSRQRRQT